VIILSSGAGKIPAVSLKAEKIKKPLATPQGLATTDRGCKNKPGKSIY